MSPQKPLDRPERRHPEHEDTDPPAEDLGSKRWPVVGGVRIPPAPRQPSGHEIDAIREANERPEPRKKPQPETVPPSHPSSSDEMLRKMRGASAFFHSLIRAGWAGAVVAISIAFTVLIYVAGPHIDKIKWPASAKSVASVEKSQDEIKEVLRRVEAAQAEDRQTMSLILKRQAYEASLLCQLNQGRPHFTWPCGEVPWEAPPTTGQRIPTNVTSKPYPLSPGEKAEFLLGP